MQVRTSRPTRTDQAIAAVLAIGMVVELVLHDADLSRGIPAALLATVALAWRRIWAVAAFLVTWSGFALLDAVVKNFDEISVTFVVVFFLSTYSLGAYADGREQPISIVLIIGSILYFLFNDGDPFAIGDVPFAIVLVGGPWAAGLAIRLRQERVRTLNVENTRLQADQEEATRRAIEAERATIARELHDVVSHAISVTVLQARGARRLLGTDEDSVRRALDAIEQTNTSALSDMRRLLAVLRDTDTVEGVGDGHSPAPSLEHLPTLLDQVRESGVPVDFEVIGNTIAVPPGVDLSAYRIVQEALTNVIKHAGQATATVRLEYTADALTVSVQDDGTTPEPVNGTGHGLIGIQERVSVVGGEVTAGPNETGGFRVRARLPYSVELS